MCARKNGSSARLLSPLIRSSSFCFHRQRQQRLRSRWLLWWQILSLETTHRTRTDSKWTHISNQNLQHIRRHKCDFRFSSTSSAMASVQLWECGRYNLRTVPTNYYTTFRTNILRNAKKNRHHNNNNNNAIKIHIKHQACATVDSKLLTLLSALPGKSDISWRFRSYASTLLAP